MTRIVRKKKPLGRPPLSNEERKGKLFQVRVTAEQVDRWERAAEIAGVHVSRAARDVLDRWARRTIREAGEE